MSSSTHEAAALRLAALAEEVSALTEQLMQDDAVSAVADRTAQQLVTASARLYARKTDVEMRHFSPVTAPGAVSPTDVAVLATEMMRAVDLNIFDLSMWASRPRYDETKPVA
jgi:sulfur transfer complex TusBCD TusB component (DsrH family)